MPLNQIQIDGIHELSGNLLQHYKSDLSSCTPSSLSASFIYYYSLLNELNITKKKISDNTGISIVTIQKITNLLTNITNKNETE